jgi:hypothetical protein
MTMANIVTIDEFDPEYWAGRINAAAQKTTEGIIEAGQALLQAKQHLRPGDFHAMINDRLAFTPRTAQRLMKIAAHPVLSDATHVSRLPPSWGTLYELTKLPPKLIQAKIEDCTISPKLERKDVAKLKPGHAEAKHKARLSRIIELKQENEERLREIADLQERLANAERVQESEKPPDGPKANPRILIRDIRYILEDRLPHVRRNAWPNLAKDLHALIDEVMAAHRA